MPKLLLPWYSSDGQYARLPGHTPRPIIRQIVTSRGQIARVTATGAVLVAADPTTRPTGVDYYPVENLIQPGDIQADGTANWSLIFQRNRTATENKIITFPEGEFVASNFTDQANTFQSCIQIPKWWRGIYGSGKGTLGGSSGTIFSIKPMSSDKAYPAKDSNGNYYVPLQGTSTPVQLTVLKQNNQLYAGTWQNFQVRGTAQGHIFCGMQIYGTVGKNIVTDVLTCGWEGDNGAPPGETSGLSMNGPGAHVFTRLEIDGRRAVGGIAYGAMGATFQNSVGATFVSCISRYCRASNFVGYQAFNMTLIDCIIDAASAGGQGIGNGGMNFERTAGCRLIRPKLNARYRKVHITFSNDEWSLTQDGVSYSTKGGPLDVVDPDPVNGNPFDNNYLYIQTWTPYRLGTFGTGNSMTYPGATGSDGTKPNDGPDTSPQVYKSTPVDSTGRGPGITYVWAFEKNRVLPGRHDGL